MVSELGKCPSCGEQGILVLIWSGLIDYDEDGQQTRLTITTGSPICRHCRQERPDLVCREGRIEKREAKNDG